MAIESFLGFYKASPIPFSGKEMLLMDWAKYNSAAFGAAT